MPVTTVERNSNNNRATAWWERRVGVGDRVRKGGQANESDSWVALLMHKLTMQCAWCRRRYDESGVEEEPLPTLLPEASHGLCLNCLYALVKRQCERLAARGDVVRARQAERTRWRLLVLLVRRQFERVEPAAGYYRRENPAPEQTSPAPPRTSPGAPATAPAKKDTEAA